MDVQIVLAAGGSFTPGDVNVAGWVEIFQAVEARRVTVIPGPEGTLSVVPRAAVRDAAKARRTQVTAVTAAYKTQILAVIKSGGPRKVGPLCAALAPIGTDPKSIRADVISALASLKEEGLLVTVRPTASNFHVLWQLAAPQRAPEVQVDAAPAEEAVAPPPAATPVVELTAAPSDLEEVGETSPPSLDEISVSDELSAEILSDLAEDER